MSRVHKPNKYMNTPTGNRNGPLQKWNRVHYEGEDYHKSKTLTSWLFYKYNISYKTFRNKSKNRRNELRKEFKEDTGININKAKADCEYENAMVLLSDIGVSFSPDGNSSWY